MNHVLRTLTVAGALAAPIGAVAAPAPKLAVPTVSDVLKASGITASGYFDAGFNWNNRQYDAGPFTYGGANDQSITLNQVALTLAATPASGFGGVVDLLGGHDAPALPSDAHSDIIFKQAYAQYARGNLTLMGGRFVTLAGSEVIASTGNSNATRSLLFGYQPTTHTGVRASYKFSDAFTLTGGVNNSALGATNDNNVQKTGEVSAAVAAGGFAGALTAYKGTETDAGVAPTQAPLLVDFAGGFGAGRLALGLNLDHLDYDAPSHTKTVGAALYANFQATDVLRLGVRVERIKTRDDVTATRTQSEATLTAAAAAAANFDIVADLRHDKDDALPFNGEDKMFGVTLKGIYKF